MNKEIIKPKILIYDEDKIQYITGYCGFLNVYNEPEQVNYIDGHSEYLPSLSSDFSCSISNYEELNNIELDETTMKRIAKFNKEQECKRLDEKIESKKAKIKELDDILKDKEKRVDKLKKYIINIFDIDIDDEDDDYYDYD